MQFFYSRKLFILSLCQALYWCSVITGITLSGIVGSLLADDLFLATLPAAILTLGAILSTTTVSLMMQKYGRRFGFLTGAVSGVAGGMVCTLAIIEQHFILFCVGNGLLGIFQATAMYYRFAATDNASVEQRGRAMSWVMAGGIVAALIAPSLALWSKNLLASNVYAGSYLFVTTVSLVTFFVCFFLLGKTGKRKTKLADSLSTGRPTLSIIKQARFIVALLNMSIGHGVMILLMITTPLAIVGCGLPVNDAGTVIQWHVLGMFLPSFFSGKLVDRVGATPVSIAGACILLLSSGIALADTGFINFWASSLLLGLGWNFMYTAGSTMIVASHTEQERGRIQGLSELITNAVASAFAFLSGALFKFYGWSGINISMLFLILFILLVSLAFSTRQQEPPGLERP